MCGFIAQLVEHRTGITEVMGLDPIEALIFRHLSNRLNRKIYCNHHSSLSSTTTVHIIMNDFIYTSHHFTPHRKIWTQLIDLTSNVWLRSSVGRALHQYHEGHGFESRWSLDFFRLLLSNCLNWKIYCNDHSSLSSTAAVHIWIIPYYILHNGDSTWTLTNANWPTLGKLPKR